MDWLWPRMSNKNASQPKFKLASRLNTNRAQTSSQVEATCDSFEYYKRKLPQLEFSFEPGLKADIFI
jgi:hypothetical protein